MLAAAAALRELWGEDLELPDLAEDIAVEARPALRITEELKERDDRIDALVRERDPRGIITSAPGVGPVNGAVILGRLGDPDDSDPSPRCAPSAAWSPHSTPQESPVATAAPPSVAMPCSVKRCSSAQTRPAGKTRVSPRNITAHGRIRLIPQHRDLPHRRTPTHQDRSVLERRGSPRTPRRRRHAHHHRRRASDHPSAIHRPGLAPASTHHDKNEPAKQEVAARSINRPVSAQGYPAHRRLTFLRNSTVARSDPQRSSCSLCATPSSNTSVQESENPGRTGHANAASEAIDWNRPADVYAGRANPTIPNFDIEEILPTT